LKLGNGNKVVRFFQTPGSNIHIRRFGKPEPMNKRPKYHDVPCKKLFLQQRRSLARHLPGALQPLDACALFFFSAPPHGLPVHGHLVICVREIQLATCRRCSGARFAHFANTGEDGELFVGIL
jgi:hypothetical protein